MQSLFALVVVALTACAIAHPPVLRDADDDPLPNEPPNRKSIRDYLLPRYLRSAHVAVDKMVRIPYPRPQMPASDWLNKEIDRINRMEDRAPPQHAPYNSELPPWIPHESLKHKIFGPVGTYGSRSIVSPYFEYPLSSKALLAGSTTPRKHAKVLHQIMDQKVRDHEGTEVPHKPHEEKKTFALTPLDEGYFEPTEKDNSSNKAVGDMMEAGPHEGGWHEDLEELGPRRQIRQNPIGRTKTLVAEDLDKLRTGVGRHQMRIPVSLIPVNLNWLNIPKDIKNELNDSDADSKDMPKYYRVLGSDFATGTIYAVGIAAGVGTAILLAIFGFIFGWYVLSKRAKAAADVDYPAYGVTGPTTDTSGDRKLAHSAQMYHYQHQKQQIIAMERTNVEERNGSVSDPESEEENEEGDYTVYECPGFATTGEMEVKNPLFNEESTPATPGMLEVVKPQPKE